MNLLSAFIEALCSVSFYKKVNGTSLSKGFQYLLLWSLFTSLLVFLLIWFRVFPTVHEFAGWFKSEMPVVALTSEGLSMDKPSPYVMKSPKFGHVATFDMSRKEVSSEEMGDAIVYVTSEKAYAREPGRKDMRVYDLVSKNAKNKEAKFVFDQSLVDKFEQTLKPIVLVVFTALSFIFFFVWKLLAALFYSIPASMINQTRNEKLPYEAVLNVSIFSMTASMWIFFIVVFLSDIVNIPFGFLGSMIVTTIYLYLGLKATEDPEPPVYL